MNKFWLVVALVLISAGRAEAKVVYTWKAMNTDGYVGAVIDFTLWDEDLARENDRDHIKLRLESDDWFGVFCNLKTKGWNAIIRMDGVRNWNRPRDHFAAVSPSNTYAWVGGWGPRDDFTYYTFSPQLKAFAINLLGGGTVATFVTGNSFVSSDPFGALARVVQACS